MGQIETNRGVVGGGIFSAPLAYIPSFWAVTAGGRQKNRRGGSLGHLYFTLAGGLWDVLGEVTFETSAHG